MKRNTALKLSVLSLSLCCAPLFGCAVVQAFIDPAGAQAQAKFDFASKEVPKHHSVAVGIAGQSGQLSLKDRAAGQDAAAACVASAEIVAKDEPQRAIPTSAGDKPAAEVVAECKKLEHDIANRKAQGCFSTLLGYYVSLDGRIERTTVEASGSFDHVRPEDFARRVTPVSRIEDCRDVPSSSDRVPKGFANGASTIARYCTGPVTFGQQGHTELQNTKWSYVQYKCFGRIGR